MSDPVVVLPDPCGFTVRPCGFVVRPCAGSMSDLVCFSVRPVRFLDPTLWLCCPTLWLRCPTLWFCWLALWRCCATRAVSLSDLVVLLPHPKVARYDPVGLLSNPAVLLSDLCGDTIQPCGCDVDPVRVCCPSLFCLPSDVSLSTPVVFMSEPCGVTVRPCGCVARGFAVRPCGFAVRPCGCALRPCVVVVRRAPLHCPTLCFLFTRCLTLLASLKTGVWL